MPRLTHTPMLRLLLRAVSRVSSSCSSAAASASAAALRAGASSVAQACGAALSSAPLTPCTPAALAEVTALTVQRRRSSGASSFSLSCRSSNELRSIAAWLVANTSAQLLPVGCLRDGAAALLQPLPLPTHACMHPLPLTAAGALPHPSFLLSLSTAAGAPCLQLSPRAPQLRPKAQRCCSLNSQLCDMLLHTRLCLCCAAAAILCCRSCLLCRTLPLTCLQREEQCKGRAGGRCWLQCGDGPV